MYISFPYLTPWATTPHIPLLQVRVQDAPNIAARCKAPGPFSASVLSDEELGLLDALLRRVDVLAGHAAKVRTGRSSGSVWCASVQHQTQVHTTKCRHAHM